MCLCLISSYVHFNPDPLVSYAAIHKGISTKMYTANQHKALCLEILKTQTNEILASNLKLRHGGEVCLHLLICSPDIPFCSFSIEAQQQICAELINLLNLSQPLPRFS